MKRGDKMKKIISVMGILILGLFALSSCGQEKSADELSKNINENVVAKEFVIQSFTEVIDGKYFPKFSPSEIIVKKGDNVRIKITNIKGTHDFKIDEFKVYAETPLNEEVTIEFTADKAGEFEYYCTKPGHRANGHWGTLRVVE